MFPPIEGDPFFVVDSACDAPCDPVHLPLPSTNDAAGEVAFSKFKVDELTDNPVRNALVHAGLLSAHELFGFVEATRSNAQGSEAEGEHSRAAPPVWDRADWQGPSPCCDFIQRPGEIVFVPVRVRRGRSPFASTLFHMPSIAFLRCRLLVIEVVATRRMYLFAVAE